MRTLKRALSLIPLLILWLMFSIFLWGFVFNQITDTTPDRKIVLCVDGEAPGATELAVALEEKLGDAVQMVKVRPFSYAMFDSRTLTAADLFLVPAGHVEEYLDWFAPLPEELRRERNLLEIDGVPYGILAYDTASGTGIAQKYLDYSVPGEEAQNFYLLFGKESVHMRENEKAVDGLAVTAAQFLLSDF